YRALRLDTGNFAWASEHTTRKTRIIGVVYNASNNELIPNEHFGEGRYHPGRCHPLQTVYAQPVTKKGSKAQTEGILPRTQKTFEPCTEKLAY
ncbi:hypothetical protein MPER_16443, partial [Moniliophthora perniciosa FA553]